MWSLQEQAVRTFIGNKLESGGMADVSQSESVSSLGVFWWCSRNIIHAMFGLPAGVAIFSAPHPLLWLMNTGHYPDLSARPEA